MNYKSIRILLFIGAILSGYYLIQRSDTKIEAIWMIILMAILLMSMEGVKRKQDKIFYGYAHLEAIDHMALKDFVAYISHLYKRLGYFIYSIKMNEETNCHIVMFMGKQKIAVYCPFNIEEMTKEDVEKAVQGAKANKCKHMFMVSNKYMTEEGRVYAQKNKVEVIDREALAKILYTMKEETYQNKVDCGIIKSNS